jgi:FAD:protein FMN transferase
VLPTREASAPVSVPPARLGRRDLLTLDVHPGAVDRVGEDLGEASGAVGLTPGAGADHWIRVYRAAMACRFEITLFGEDARHVPAARDALREADRLEAALTVFRDTSTLVRLNRTAADGPVRTDAELFALLEHCRDLHARTSGAFYVTSTPLSRCWGFMKREGRLPAVADIEAARARVGMDAVKLDPVNHTVRFTRPGMELNLGSIGKGYAVHRIADALLARGVRHALVSAGASSVVALGGRRGPNPGWPIDLCSRQRGGARLIRLHLRDGALGTSGAGEQFVEVDGRRYGHVLDPRTGWPASGVLSATVVCHDGATADALATAFLVAGPDLARAYCDAHAHTLAFITREGTPRPEIFGAYAGVVVEDL